MMFGAFAGLGAWAGIAIWRSRDLWLAKPEPFDGRGLLKQAAPLMLGFGACSFFHDGHDVREGVFPRR